MFYNGDMFQPDKTELRLSDAFPQGVKGDIQVKVTMLNVNYGRNRKLLQKCRPLSDYSLFTTSVRELIKRRKTKEEAVEEALKLLHDDSEMKKLVLENKAGVAKMILFEYDEKGVMEALKEEAKAEKAAEIAKAMLAKGIDLNTTSQCTGIPVTELKKLQDKLN